MVLSLLLRCPNSQSFRFHAIFIQYDWLTFKMKILTGATGFVGKVLQKLSLNFNDFRIISQKPQSALKLPKNVHCEWVRTKIYFQKKQSWWEKQLTGVDIVVHIVSLQSLNHIKTLKKC